MPQPSASTRLATVTVAAALAAGLASCGGDDEQPSTSLADTAPAGAFIYAEATVNPQDDLREQLDGLIEKVSGVSGGLDLLGQQLDAALAADDAPVSFTEDIQPVLGEQAAFWVSDLSVDEFGDLEGGTGAGVLELSDEDGAQTLIDELIAEAPGSSEQKSYEGVDYYQDSDDENGAAIGIDDGYLILGTEEGFTQTVDTLGGGDSISDSLTDPPELAGGAEGLGYLWVDVGTIVDVATEGGAADPAKLDAARELFGDVLEQPLTLSLAADDSTVAVGGSFGSLGDFGAVSGESSLLSELPGDAVLVAAANDVGTTTKQIFEQAPELGGTITTEGLGGSTGELDLETLDSQFESFYGFSITEVLESIGDYAVFVRPGSGLIPDGALVIEVLDEEILTTLLDQARTTAGQAGVRLGPNPVADSEGFTVTSRELPFPLIVALKDGKLVTATSEEAANDAFDPGETISQTEGFEAAQDAIGEDLPVGLYADLEGAGGLLDAIPGAREDPNVAQFLAVLDRLSYFVYGAGEDDEKTTFGLALGAR